VTSANDDMISEVGCSVYSALDAKVCCTHEDNVQRRLAWSQHGIVQVKTYAQ
jgi:hypothetical protein